MVCKEKLLAAHRGGIKRVLIPKENERDLEEIPANVENKIFEIYPVRWIDRCLHWRCRTIRKVSNAFLSCKC